MNDNVEQRNSSNEDDSPADVQVRDKGDHRDQEGIDQRGEGAARRQFALLGRRFAKGALRLDGNGDEEQANQRAIGGEAGGEECREHLWNQWNSPFHQETAMMSLEI